MADLGRFLFGLSLLVSWGISVVNALSAQRLPYTRGIDPRADIPWRRLPLCLAGLTVLFLLTLELFVLRRRQELAGIALFGFIALARRIEASQWQGTIVVDLGKYAPSAACLAAYLVAFWASAGMPVARREACGWEAACGVLAAAYALSAWIKWKKASFAWMKSGNMGLLIAERSYDGAPILRRLRLFVVSSPRLCSLFAALGFLLEGADGLFVLGSLRWPLTLATLLFHAGITAFLGYFEVEWILVMVSLTLASGAG